MVEQPGGAKGVGARVLRKEDDRYMRGRGQYIADIGFVGVKDVAFYRSPVAHGRLNGITFPPHLRGRVFTNADMVGVKPITALTALPNFKPSVQPPLATGKVRHVGELVAMCLGDTRAEAEDVVAELQVDIDELPAAVDILESQAADAPLVHDEWGDNINLTSTWESDLAAAKAAATHVVSREFRTNRQCMVPIEGRGAVAEWNSRLNQLVLHSSTQMSHLVRTGIAECLGLEEAQVRVVAPDVGGGFGYKGIMTPEEVCLAWLAMQCGHPVRWLEDRREHLTASANCREHHYRMTTYTDDRGRILGLEGVTAVNVGAYSSYPVSSGLEGAQIVSNLPGPYVVPAYRCVNYSVASNKPPILPYRGVARTGVCFAMELMIDAIARAVGREPSDVRLENLVPPSAMPYTSVTGKNFDSGDYPHAIGLAVDAIDLASVRRRQQTREPDGRRIGVGFSFFTEQGAHGTSIFHGWGIPMVPGHEQAVARLTPDGSLELRIGAHSHGQGMETTLAQVAHEVLSIDLQKVKLVHGDTEYTPYSTGTWGSRGAVMSGGAVAVACKELGQRITRIAGHLMQTDPAQLRFADGAVVGPNNRMSIREVAEIWYHKPQLLAPDVHPGGLEVTAGYKPRVDTGTFSYACHAVVVAVDVECGSVEILDYVVVEDGGKLINPMVVDGQIYGGVAQGIGTALYEEMPFDSAGQPLASTLADYLLPGSAEVPAIRLIHMETLSPNTEFGVKGIGESGAIGPPAAIANAVNDALRPLGVEVAEVPLTPHRILSALAAARVGSPS
ncbi:MAG TPA: xanthine dehydrogenase family protein molybdopterin-binding subunit [Bauldia sp.]|nr:xanthine dehydrogenase family protein molybdopterin-binding subunit [Bauldia sp.]